MRRLNLRSQSFALNNLPRIPSPGLQTRTASLNKYRCLYPERERESEQEREREKERGQKEREREGREAGKRGRQTDQQEGVPCLLAP